MAVRPAEAHDALIGMNRKVTKMRIDFSAQQIRGDDEQRLVRLIRATRAIVCSLFIAALVVVVFKSPPLAGESLSLIATGETAQPSVGGSHEYDPRD